MTFSSGTTLSDIPNSLLGQFLSFLRRPLYPSPERRPARDPLVPVLKLYSLSISLIIPVGILLSIISSTVYKLDENAIQKALESQPPYRILFLAVVMAPLIEEAIFRLPLRYSPLNVTLSLTLGLLFILSTVPGSQSMGIAIAMVAVLVLAFLLYFGLQNLVESASAKVWFAKHLKILVYATAGLFGVAHITNYPLEAWPLLPILVMPQLIIGFFLAFIRLQYGFPWAIFTHAFHNLLMLSMVLLPLSLGSPQLKDQLLKTNPDAKLLPQDYVLMGSMSIAALIGLGVIGLTTYRLWQEWRTEKQNLQSLRLSHPSEE